MDENGIGGQGHSPATTRIFQTQNQPIKRSAVSAGGRKHQRPITAYGCVSEVLKGALVEAGGGYRAKPNGMHP